MKALSPAAFTTAIIAALGAALLLAAVLNAASCSPGHRPEQHEMKSP